MIAWLLEVSVSRHAIMCAGIPTCLTSLVSGYRHKVPTGPLLQRGMPPHGGAPGYQEVAGHRMSPFMHLGHPVGGNVPWQHGKCRCLCCQSAARGVGIPSHKTVVLKQIGFACTSSRCLVMGCSGPSIFSHFHIDSSQKQGQKGSNAV